MDIDFLAKMVKEAVMDHDSVTLPGMGSFVAELVPATFADRGYTILPPYRRLYFSPNQGDDQLLARMYAQANGVSETQAARVITEFIAEMKEVLKERKTLVLTGLGRLRATRENNFFFVADVNLDIYPAGFGLEPVSLKTHVEDQAQGDPSSPVAPQDDKEDCHSERSEESLPKRKHPGLRILLTLLILAIIAAAALAVLGRVAPEWVDVFLYTPEQLEILYN